MISKASLVERVYLNFHVSNFSLDTTGKEFYETIDSIRDLKSPWVFFTSFIVYYCIIQTTITYNKGNDMALTTEKIYAAADQLHADGVVPTQTKLREALGGGSFSTIGEALKSWKQAQQENEQLKRSDMPDGLRDEGVVFIAKLWKEAEQIANASLSVEREAFAEEQAKRQAEIEDANEAIATLEGEKANDAQLLKRSEARGTQALRKVEALAQEVATLKTAYSDLQHALEMEKTSSAHVTSLLSAAHEQLNNSHSELEMTHTQLTAARETIATYKATDSAQKGDIARLESDVADTKQTLASTLSQLTERTTERDDLAKQLASTSSKLDSAKDRNKQLTAELKSITAENKTLIADNSSLQTVNERMNDENLRLLKDGEQLTAELKQQSLEGDRQNEDEDKTALAEKTSTITTE